VHSDGDDSTSYVPFTQEELKELRSKQEEERKREERETKEVSKKYNDSESEEVHRKQKEEKQKREEKKPREQKPESVVKGEDPYKILGVKQNVTCTELKSKFRELAKKHSPDPGIVNMTEQEKERKTSMFIKIKKAYDELRKSKNCQD
jgi:DnaJ-domain-containing protein 1